PEGTAVPIPEDAVAGDYTVSASDPDGNSGEGAVSVYTPAIDVPDQVPAGRDVVVSSGGWVAGSEVTLQLVDPSGEPVGDAVTATADESGTLPAGTLVPVPADAAIGTGYSVTARDAQGAQVSDAFEVLHVDAVSPAVTVTSPVPAGGEAGITSGGWAPGTEVTIQLTDPEGNPVGDPITVTTDDRGNTPEGTAVTIPEDATAGDYTVSLSDGDGNEAEGTVAVYAPSLEVPAQVAAGDDVAVTSGGWVAGSTVTLQLVNPAGDPVGDPVEVTVDADGNLPEGTVLPVPADAELAAGYSVVASDTTGAKLTAPLEVVGADNGGGDNGSGDGDGDGNGGDNGSGDGDGNGNGGDNGSGDGDGDGNGGDNGSGDGDGNGNGGDNGSDDGTGNGSGNGTGNGSGNGSSNGSDQGSGSLPATGATVAPLAGLGALLLAAGAVFMIARRRGLGGSSE
ncbi:LPXTG cell wall anchor domain-containing protein, partial [Brachybacterium hainanense]